MNTSPLVRRRSGLIILLTGAAVLMAFLSFSRESFLHVSGIQAANMLGDFAEPKELMSTTNSDCDGHTSNTRSFQAASLATNDFTDPIDPTPTVDSLYKSVTTLDLLLRSGIAMAAMLGGFGSVGGQTVDPWTGAVPGSTEHWEWPNSVKLNDISIFDDQPSSMWVMETGPPGQNAW